MTLPFYWFHVPDGILLVLLFTGHILADFLFQTDGMIQRKASPRTLWLHAAVVLITHAVLVLPFVHWSPGGLAGALTLLLLLAAIHALIDVAKLRWTRRHGDSVACFLIDQAGHVVAILAVWGIWRTWLGFEPGPLAPENLTPLTALCLILSVYVLNGQAAATLIRLFLGSFDAPDADSEDTQRMGRTIGILERMLVVSLILLGQWAAIGWVFAAKTLARFKELDQKSFSEYYLVGTLSSVIFSVATGALLRLLLNGTL